MPITDPDFAPRAERATATRQPARFRDLLLPRDRSSIARIVADTGLFTPAEVEVAVELVDECTARGAAAGYHFLLADSPVEELLGYTCYGPIACTQSSFDLYWIAVTPSHQGHGLGRQLLRRTEQRIAALGGRQLYAETSTRSDYVATRRFYERCGYRCESILKDFYAPGDHRATYSRQLQTLHPE